MTTKATKPKTTFRRRAHRCYELAGKTLLDHPEWTLVHGEAYFAGCDHAWLERDGFVFDVVSDELIPIDIYYSKHRGKPFARYTVQQAAEQMVRAKHWGPWHAAPNAGLLHWARSRGRVGDAP